MPNITHEKAVELIRGLVRQEGSIAKVAKKLNVSAAYISQILGGSRKVSNSIALQLGYKRVAVFKPIKDGEAEE